MNNKKTTRVNSMIDSEDYKRLKVKLIMQEKSFSQWLKEQVSRELDQSPSRS